MVQREGVGSRKTRCLRFECLRATRTSWDNSGSSRSSNNTECALGSEDLTRGSNRAIRFAPCFLSRTSAIRSSRTSSSDAAAIARPIVCLEPRAVWSGSRLKSSSRVPNPTFAPGTASARAIPSRTRSGYGRPKCFSNIGIALGYGRVVFTRSQTDSTSSPTCRRSVTIGASARRHSISLHRRASSFSRWRATKAGSALSSASSSPAVLPSCFFFILVSSLQPRPDCHRT